MDQYEQIRRQDRLHPNTPMRIVPDLIRLANSVAEACPPQARTVISLIDDHLSRMATTRIHDLHDAWGVAVLIRDRGLRSFTMSQILQKLPENNNIPIPTVLQWIRQIPNEKIREDVLGRYAVEHVSPIDMALAVRVIHGLRNETLRILYSGQLAKMFQDTDSHHRQQYIRQMPKTHVHGYALRNLPEQAVQEEDHRSPRQIIDLIPNPRFRRQTLEFLLPQKIMRDTTEVVSRQRQRRGSGSHGMQGGGHPSILPPNVKKSTSTHGRRQTPTQSRSTDGQGGGSGRNSDQDLSTYWDQTFLRLLRRTIHEETEIQRQYQKFKTLTPQTKRLRIKRLESLLLKKKI